MKQLVWQTRKSISTSVFLTEWLKSPLSVGAIAPSSSFLASAITKGLSETKGPILELGAGTGVFTSAILRNGICARDLAVFEIGDEFVDQLADTYPHIRVIKADATSVSQTTPFPLASVQVVVCGLPLLSMTQAKVQKIIAGSFECLNPNGEFRLFTYGYRCPIAKQLLDQLSLEAYRSSVIFRNLPPASVYIIKRKSA